MSKALGVVLLKAELSVNDQIHLVLQECDCVLYHAGCAPDICWRTVASSCQHLERTILPCLDVICEMFVLQEEEKSKEKEK